MLALSSPLTVLACHQQTRHISADDCAVLSVGGVHRSSTPRVALCFPFLASSQPHCTISLLSSSFNANHATMYRVNIHTCADDEMTDGESNGVWSARLSVDRKRATSPRTSRLLLARLWLLSNHVIGATVLDSEASWLDKTTPTKHQ